MNLHEGRFSRFEAIDWWNQKVISGARILVIGAGALGNEVIKNFALLGVGNLVIVDLDSIEESNLSRSVLFRSSDEGASKAKRAADAARAIYPQMGVEAIEGNVLCDVGLGYFRWAQIVIGAVDNREARLYINRVCAKIGRPWIDGGIDVLQGIVRVFAPPETACYECTMSEADWHQVNERRSCSLLARHALQNRGVPTTPTTASVIGALQAQEALKMLHGMESLYGQGYLFEGARHGSFTVQYQVSPGCEHHEPPLPVLAIEEFQSNTTLRQVWKRAEREMGKIDALDIDRELLELLECDRCRKKQRILRPAETITSDQALCPTCKSERAPQFLHSISAESDLLDHSISELGLPRREILWARQNTKFLGLEMSGDTPVQEGQYEASEK